ncbi:WD40 repeat-like protein [Acephala macrosclerotiorum]|nr:WD40 repeat-like protein [Acephala macrosclerotiorum]
MGRLDITIPLLLPSQLIWRQGSAVFSNMLRGHTDRVTDMAFSSSERLLATGSWDQTINILEPDTRQLLKTFKCDYYMVEAFAFTPDDQFLAAANGSPDEIHIWNVNTGDQVKALRDPSCVYSVTFSPCGMLLASGSGSRDPTVRLWR